MDGKSDFFRHFQATICAEQLSQFDLPHSHTDVTDHVLEWEVPAMKFNGLYEHQSTEIYAVIITLLLRYYHVIIDCLYVKILKFSTYNESN